MRTVQSKNSNGIGKFQEGGGKNAPGFRSKKGSPLSDLRLTREATASPGQPCKPLCTVRAGSPVALLRPVVQSYMCLQPGIKSTNLRATAPGFKSSPVIAQQRLRSLTH